MEEGVKLIVDKFWQGSRVDGRCYSGWIDLVTENRSVVAMKYSSCRPSKSITYPTSKDLKPLVDCEE